MADPNLRHVDELVKEVVEREDEVRDLLRRVLEAALAAVMEAEVSEVVGARHGERSKDRRTYRNGYRVRRFDTPLGTHELAIPKMRHGSYFPSFLAARQRSDDALRLALVECFKQGVSTRRAETVAAALGVRSMSRSTVSRMVEALDPLVEEFRGRSLPACPYVFFDARYEHVREDHAVRKVAVLVALGVREDGGREVLGFATARTENDAYWSDFLRSLRNRGLERVRLVVSDAHEGLRRAIERELPEARWQRCKVHFLRNLGSRIPRKRRPALMSLAKTVFQQDSHQEALHQRVQVAEVLREAGHDNAAEFLETTDEVLTYMSFPQEHWTKLHSTNVVERLNRELKRRTRLVSIFPNRTSLERLVGALLLEEHEEWIIARRYISEVSMQKLLSPEQQLDALAPGASRLLAEKAA